MNLHCNIKYILLLILVLLLFKSNAQERKINLIFNSQLTHSIGIGKLNNNNILYKYGFTFTPGVELLFEVKLGKNYSVLSGTNYYRSILRNGNDYKLQTLEISFPILLSRKINQKYCTSIGFYPGLSIEGHIKNYFFPDEKWYNIPSSSDMYNNERFFLDLYFDIRKCQPVFKKQVLLISPFIKYKLNDYWIGKFRSKIQYGLKLGFNINL